MAKPIRQVGSIPYFVKNGKARFVLITPKGVKGVWIVPKGHIEEEHGPAGSAELEALEEAGVKGRVKGKPVGIYKYRKWNRPYSVTVYALKVDKVLPSWDEDDERERCIVKRKRALELLGHDELSEMINRVAKKAEDRG